MGAFTDKLKTVCVLYTGLSVFPRILGSKSGCGLSAVADYERGKTVCEIITKT